MFIYIHWSLSTLRVDSVRSTFFFCSFLSANIALFLFCPALNNTKTNSRRRHLSSNAHTRTMSSRRDVFNSPEYLKIFASAQRKFRTKQLTSELSSLQAINATLADQRTELNGKRARWLERVPEADRSAVLEALARRLELEDPAVALRETRREWKDKMTRGFIGEVNEEKLSSLCIRDISDRWEAESDNGVTPKVGHPSSARMPALNSTNTDMHGCASSRQLSAREQRAAKRNISNVFPQVSSGRPMYAS